MNEKKSFFESCMNILFFRSWWIFLILLLGYLPYNHAIKAQDKMIHASQAKIEQLEKTMKKAHKEQDDLLLQVHSQSDPAWVELILKRELGVVPEGCIKVHFRSD